MFMIVDVTIDVSLRGHWMCVIQWPRRGIIGNREEENSRFCLERHYLAEAKSIKQKELSKVNKRTVFNVQHL